MGKEGADFSFKIHHQDIFETSLTFFTPDESLEATLPLTGEYNVYNATAAVAAAMLAGFSLAHSVQALGSFAGVSGRLEKVTSKEDAFQVFVDYAHTPIALKEVLKNLNSLKSSGRLILVFGCGGMRDKEKRGEMAEVALEFSDQTILTSDNPRHESPEGIIEDCLRELPKNHQFIVEQDRKKAIEQACHLAEKGDFVLIAGKGHEEFQIIKDKKLPFSDKKIVQNILRKK